MKFNGALILTGVTQPKNVFNSWKCGMLWMRGSTRWCVRVGEHFYEFWGGLYGSLKKKERKFEKPLRHSRLEEMCCFWDPPASVS